MTKKRKRKNSWSNYGDGIQVYDVCFEVDKLDYIRLTEGKDSDKYKNQHNKAVSLIVGYNAENKGAVPLNLSRCRLIISSPHHQEDLVFYNNGKTVASNK